MNHIFDTNLLVDKFYKVNLIFSNCSIVSIIPAYNDLVVDNYFNRFL